MKTKIIICCPGKTFSSKFLRCITQLTKHFDNKGYEYMLSNTYSRNIYETRNKCLLGNPENDKYQSPFNNIDYTHILWIDDDITFTCEDFDHLFEAKRDVISGFYLMADARQYAAVKMWDEDFFSEHGYFQFMVPKDIENKTLPIRVEYVGFGFLLIKKGVFEQFEYPWFEPTYLNIRESVDFSMEDVTFCLKCKEKNISISAHPKVIVGHNKTLELRH